MSSWEVPVSFTEGEFERLAALAAADGVTVSEYVRQRVFGPTAAKPAPSQEAVPEHTDEQDVRVYFYDRLVEALTHMRSRAIRE